MEMVQTLFSCLITLQFLVVVLHDWVNIPGWTHSHQVQSVVGRRKLWLATIINAIFPGLAVAFVTYYWNKPKPSFVLDYWLLYCTITLLSAIAMWYVPYFFGCSEKQKREYSQMYAGTLHVLPPRGDNPRPNLLHIGFHALFVVNLCLVLMIFFRSA
jgi:hypothetical protein